MLRRTYKGRIEITREGFVWTAAAHFASGTVVKASAFTKWGAKHNLVNKLIELGY